MYRTCRTSDCQSVYDFTVLNFKVTLLFVHYRPSGFITLLFKAILNIELQYIDPQTGLRYILFKRTEEISAIQINISTILITLTLYGKKSVLITVVCDREHIPYDYVLILIN